MNIEEARRVYWLRNKHETLGKLLDEGYLTRSKLEWAASKAYNAELREAARLLLEELIASKPEMAPAPAAPVPEKKEIPLNMTLNEARAVAWMLPPHKGLPIGSLMDSGKISLKDLAYAAENAWEEKVRQAARALMLVRLEQLVKEPAPSAGFAHLVSSGRSYAERQQLRLSMLEGAALGGFLGAAIMFLIWQFPINSRSGGNTHSFVDVISDPIGILALIIVLVLTILAIWLISKMMDQLTKRLERQVQEYRQGQEGEESVVQRMLQALDGNWHLFRNVRLPGRNRGDLDLVLLGPPGLWALEVKNLRGHYRNRGEDWEYRHDKDWRKAKASPSKQASNNAIRLANFLKADGLQTYVQSAVVWANSEAGLDVENPAVAIWKYERLAEDLGNIWQVERIPEAERSKIINKLTKLCEHQD
jgi:hypothetical protein